MENKNEVSDVVEKHKNFKARKFLEIRESMNIHFERTHCVQNGQSCNVAQELTGLQV